MATRLRGRHWQADVKDNKTGKRHRATFKTKPEAKAWEAQAKLALVQNKPLPPNNKPVSNPYLTVPTELNNLGGLYVFVARTEWANKRASKDLIRNARAVVDYFTASKVLSEITAADIAQMKLHFEAQGNSPATVNRKLAALSKMLSVALENGVIERKPKISRNKERKTRFRYLTTSQRYALMDYWLDVGEADMHDLTVLLLETGARCFSEMLRLKWVDVSLNEEYVTFWETKTNRARTIPLTSHGMALIKLRQSRAKFGEDTHVFGQLSGTKVNRLWDKMRRELDGFADVTLHTLRHTCCTRLVEGGADIKRVMEWMGHENISTTLRYMQMKPQALKDVVHMLEPQNEEKVTTVEHVPIAA